MSDLNRKRLLTVVGTRPNFIKISQFHRVIGQMEKLEHRLCHTGQHFDSKMSEIFFQELKIPNPDYFLGVKASTTVGQFAQIMTGLEAVITEFKPDILLVPGDVNSTFAAAFTAHKMGVKVAHIESGLRSYDRTMPEENNRILTDAISDIYFVTEEAGLKNLSREGVVANSVHFVGNTMIDTLIAFRQEISLSVVRAELGLGNQAYVLLTMHRPATVDCELGLRNLLNLIREIAERLPVVFPIHPRTRKNLQGFGLMSACESMQNLKLIDPVGYLDFQHLTQNAAVVVTDSGGVQEETTFYQVPCITLRPNTERPCTVEIGSNTMLDFAKLGQPAFREVFHSILNGTYKKGGIPAMWDGKATERIITILANHV